MPDNVSKYPNCFYRVTQKAIIRDKQGNVLVVKEGDGGWCFPGGGIDHGEQSHEALKRELFEEAAITADFSEKFIGIETFFMEKHEAWLMWVIYEVTIEDGFAFGISQDTTAVEFRDPHSFKDKTDLWSKLIFKWATQN